VRLPVDEDDLVSCVACGLCLPHCPTYRVTGEESASPRGRIAAMRAVHSGAVADRSFTEFMDLCVQCRGCEAACPSSVPFGRLMDGARQGLVAAGGYQPWWRRAGYDLLGHHRLLLALSRAAAVAQRLRLVPARLGLPRLPLRQPPLRPAEGRGPAAGPAAGRATAGPDAWLFTGCVMDAWMRPVHGAALRVMESTGAVVGLPGRGGDCCGALHAHAGLAGRARALARRVMASMPGPASVVVDSAGCGAALKEYGHLLGTPEAAAFAARVEDVSEWLAGRQDRLPVARARPAHGVAM
jgi:glycolate oxidase iron-sulfur subunit